MVSTHKHKMEWRTIRKDRTAIEEVSRYCVGSWVGNKFVTYEFQSTLTSDDDNPLVATIHYRWGREWVFVNSEVSNIYAIVSPYAKPIRYEDEFFVWLDTKCYKVHRDAREQWVKIPNIPIIRTLALRWVTLRMKQHLHRIFLACDMFEAHHPNSIWTAICMNDQIICSIEDTYFALLDD